jgi:hypothetical protein
MGPLKRGCNGFGVWRSVFSCFAWIQRRPGNNQAELDFACGGVSKAGRFTLFESKARTLYLPAGKAGRFTYPVPTAHFDSAPEQAGLSAVVPR